MKRLLLLLALFSPVALGGIVIDGTQNAESQLSAVTLDPSVTPLVLFDATLEFSQANPLNPGETIKVDFYQGTTLVGTDTFQNETTTDITTCACIEADGLVNSNPFSIKIYAVTGTMEVDAAQIIAYDAPANTPDINYESILASLTPGGAAPPGEYGFGIVYTRIARAYNPFPRESYTMPDGGYGNGITDTGKTHNDLTPSDVIYDSLDGDVRILNMEPGSIEVMCSAFLNDGTGDVPCVAGEARVSPDGNQILYSVLYGQSYLAGSGETGFNHLVGYGATGASKQPVSCIYHYNITTRVTTKWPDCAWPESDRYPTWISNDEVVFASTRGNGYPSIATGGWQINPDGSQRWGYPYASSSYTATRSMTLWTADPAGNNKVEITPHDDMAIRPFIRPNGDILYSCWQNQESLAFDASNKNNFPGTTQNNFWLCRLNQDGADTTSLFGAHHSPGFTAGGVDPAGGDGKSELRAIRSIGEDADGYLYINNYYTKTHLGLGSTWRFQPFADPTVEGNALRRFLPDTTSNYLEWGQDADNPSWYDPDHGPMGINGYYVWGPNNKAFISWGRGVCYEAAQVWQLGDPDYMMGQPTCDLGLYEIADPAAERSLTPFGGNMIKVVDTLEYHEIDMDIVAPYNQKYPGQSAPLAQDNSDKITPDSNECYLNIVDATKSELTKPAYEWDFTKPGYDNWDAGRNACVIPLGCGTYAKDPSEIKYFAVYGVETHTDYDEYINNSNVTGKPHNLMGIQPVSADGSVRVRVPCDTSFKMGGLDENERLLSMDQIEHSLRPGEERFCHGCHDGHGIDRALEIGLPAITRFQGTDADIAPDPAVLDGAYKVTWINDVFPLLQAKCASCHDSDTGDTLGGGTGTFKNWTAIAYDPIQGQVVPPYEKAYGRNQAQLGAVLGGTVYLPGTGYQAGDPLVFSSGSGYGSVSTVGTNGEVLTVTVGGGSYGRLAPPEAIIQSDTGTGAAVSMVITASKLDRPYTSKYVNKFSLDSLLYWKCVNERTDGRLDSDLADDIDFGAAHPTDATAADCKMLGDWIDMGVRYK